MASNNSKKLRAAIFLQMNHAIFQNVFRKKTGKYMLFKGTKQKIICFEYMLHITNKESFKTSWNRGKKCQIL